MEFPSEKERFLAFELTPFDEVKVVILGQEPYPNPKLAHGLAFSVPKGAPLPATLKNIFKELESDLQQTAPKDGCLIPWAMQGVLLLNCSLSTTSKTKEKSKRKSDWKPFIQHVLLSLAHRKNPPIFVLWGKTAQSYLPLLKQLPNLKILTASHPSPQSAHISFFGSRPFSKINKYLKSQGLKPIHWS